MYIGNIIVRAADRPARIIASHNMTNWCDLRRHLLEIEVIF